MPNSCRPPSTRLPPLRRVVLPRADIQVHSRRGLNTRRGYSVALLMSSLWSRLPGTGIQ